MEKDLFRVAALLLLAEMLFAYSERFEGSEFWPDACLALAGSEALELVGSEFWDVCLAVVGSEALACLELAVVDGVITSSMYLYKFIPKMNWSSLGKRTATSLRTVFHLSCNL